MARQDDPSLADVARHVVTPLGIRSTAWPSTRETCKRLGWGFDRWQDDAGRLILAKSADGQYAADAIVISIPRQVGKTYTIAAIIFALCLLNPGLKVIWTAHRKTTAVETFQSFEGMAKRPKVAPHVAQVRRGKGDEQITFLNGSVIMFGARESGFGRGMSDVDVLVLDEGQILGESTLEDMGATQNVAKNPLTFVMGTPPRPKDDGAFFTLLRDEAISGESEGTLYIEMSADEDADPMDRAQWRKANPSFPRRTTERAMLRLRKKLRSDDSWRREALGIWDKVANFKSPFSAWAARISGNPPADGVSPSAIGVDMSSDRTISIAACWNDPEIPGDTHLELVSLDDSGDTTAAVSWLVARAGRRISVVVDGASLAASLIPALRLKGVKVVTTNATDMGKGCGGLFDALREERAWHLGQSELDKAFSVSRKRDIGSAGAWGLRPATPADNISPAVATVLAHFGAQVTRTKSWTNKGKAGWVM